MTDFEREVAARLEREIKAARVRAENLALIARATAAMADWARVAAERVWDGTDGALR